MAEPVVVAKQVTKSFGHGRAAVTAVDRVSIAIAEGETLGLVGESGSGKSTLGRLILALHTPDGGSVTVRGTNLAMASAREVRSMRKLMTAVFQEPLESLDPRMSIGGIVGEPLRIHMSWLGRTERRHRVVEALESVALGPNYLERYPRQLSGGQQQRVNIARAIVTGPSIVVLDEPTSALDLSVQAQILRLLRRLQEERGLAYLFISHNIDCVAFMSHRLAVMYRGRLVEVGSADAVLNAPVHPYTAALLASVLPPDPAVPLPRVRTADPVGSIRGGCPYAAHCPVKDPRCTKQQPELIGYGPGHYAATHCRLDDIQ